MIDKIGSTLSTTYKSQYQMFGPNGRFYIRHQYEEIAWSSLGVTPSTMTRFGIANVKAGVGDPSTSPGLLYLAAPEIGCEKTIVVGSTAAYVNTIDVDLGAGVRVQGSSDGRFIAFSSLAGDYQSLTLVGLSTALWAVKAINSTALFNAATGIRATTVARTS